MSDKRRMIWSNGGFVNFRLHEDRTDMLVFTNDDDTYYEEELTADEVEGLINALQEWLRDAFPMEKPKVLEDDTMENLTDEFLPYVQKLNEAMEKMHEGLREVGAITHEMDEKKMFGRYRPTLAISEQNFVSAFMLYKTLMVDAVAALYQESKKE